MNRMIVISPQTKFMGLLVSPCLSISPSVVDGRIRAVAYLLFSQPFQYFAAISIGSRGCILRKEKFKMIKLGYFTEFY